MNLYSHQQPSKEQLMTVSISLLFTEVVARIRDMVIGVVVKISI